MIARLNSGDASWRLRANLTACLALFVVLGAASKMFADTVIGNWESGTAEGWIDWSSGQIPAGPPRFAFNGIGATVGTGALQFNLPTGGYSQWASIKLQDTSTHTDGTSHPDYRNDFMSNTKLSFDLTLVASEAVVDPGNNYATIDPIINADGYGFNGQGNPESFTPFTGSNGDNTFNPQNLVGTQTTTWTYDIGHLHDGNTGNGEITASPSFIEIIFESYSNGGLKYHLDNVRFWTPVPEPTSFVLMGLAVPCLVIGGRWLGKKN